jgi:hypothetical protein
VGMQHSEQQLLWALQALAQAAEVQPRLFPPFVSIADELALEFGDWYRVAVGQVGASWQPEQAKRLATLDRLLSEMTGTDQPELWLGPDCLWHPKWSEVRGLARSALAAFGWPQDLPPLGRAVYVQGPRPTNDTEP